MPTPAARHANANAAAATPPRRRPAPLGRLAALVCGCLAACVGSVAAAEPAEPLTLAAGGRTDYAIVVGHDAGDAVRFAAEELSHFLERASGAAFPVVTDRQPPRDAEIVLGATARFDPGRLPADLRPAPPVNREGFAIHSDGARLVILGNTDRATLYGVYDFLEQELGCRFLADDATHVPRRDTLRLAPVSRRFDPVLEYRNLHQGTTRWSVRNRLNAVWGAVPMERLIGGARFIGPTFVHTFGQLVPKDRYFADHPGYYALWEGKRVPAEKNGKDGGLCLTHPDVAAIAIDTVRSWIDEYQSKPHAHPDTLLLVSVSANDDHHLVCQCPRCAAVNEEEGAPSGTLLRFVNRVADALADDYPMVRVETLAYGFSETPPKRTRPRGNVVVRFAPISADFARPFDDPDSERNRPVAENLRNWSHVTDAIYIWDYRTNFHAYLKPFPDLRVLDQNMRFLVDHGLRGYYAQTAQTEAAAFSKLRRYVLARLAWRPDTDARQTIEEFCRLYYGDADAPRVLRYIDAVHDHFLALNIPLRWRDGSSPDGADYPYAFLAQADDLLDSTGAAADTPQRQRIDEVRLGVWYLLLEKAFAGEVEADAVLRLPIQWRFRPDPDDAGRDRAWHQRTGFDDWAPIRTDDSWTNQGHDYHGVAWYALAFDVPADLAGRLDTISFGAIDGEHHSVFLDGRLIDDRRVDPRLTWNQPFRVAVPEPLSAGGHTLVVRTRKSSKAAGVWRPVTLVSAAAGVPQRVRTAGERFIQVAEELGVTHLSEFYGKPGEQLQHYFPRVRALLMQRPGPASGGEASEGGGETPGGVRQAAALMRNPHRTYRVVFDEAALQGSCVVQTADEAGTLLQSIRWNEADEPLRRAAATGEPWTVRARIRVDAAADGGPRFALGIAARHGKEKNWAATVVTQQQLTPPGGDGWRWYDLPVPADLSPEPGVKYFVFVRPLKTPSGGRRATPGGGGVYVDTFELAPGR